MKKCKSYCDVCRKPNPEYHNSIYFMLPSFDWINDICEKCRSRLDKITNDTREAYTERMKHFMELEIEKIRKEKDE